MDFQDSKDFDFFSHLMFRNSLWIFPLKHLLLVHLSSLLFQMMSVALNSFLLLSLKEFNSWKSWWTLVTGSRPAREHDCSTSTIIKHHRLLFSSKSADLLRPSKGRNPERAKYGRSASHCCQPITCFMTESGGQVDESILRDNESLHHPEAAGWWHVRQRADGEKQRVWGAGSYKKVRLVLHFCP